jgi:hypothetical protein
LPSVSFSMETSVDNRLKKYMKEINKTKKTQLKFRTDGIDNLLSKAGY